MKDSHMKTNETIQIRKPADWFILKMKNTDKTAIDDKGQTQHINLIPSLPGTNLKVLVVSKS